MGIDDTPSEKEATPSEQDTSDDTVWDWITVMRGEQIAGRDKIWFGRYEEPVEQMQEDAGVILYAEPVESIPLPRSMTREEITDFLADGWWEEIIAAVGRGDENAS